MLLQNSRSCRHEYISWKSKLRSTNTSFNACFGQRFFPGAYRQQWEWQGATDRAAQQKETEVSCKEVAY